MTTSERGQIKALERENKVLRKANKSVDGADKVWGQMNREGIRVATTSCESRTPPTSLLGKVGCKWPSRSAFTPGASWDGG